MSFLTDDDINKRSRNLFPALESSQSPTLTTITALTSPQFLANYQAIVPAVVFVGFPFSPPTAGSVITLSADQQTVTLQETGGTSGTVLGANTTSYFARACWEYRIDHITQNFLTVSMGNYVNGVSVYDPDAPIGGQAALNVASYYSQIPLLPGARGFCAANPPQVVLTLNDNDVVGIVIDQTDTYFFLNGILQAGPLATGLPPATDTQPFVSIQNF